jgi:hypothetical protein
LLQKQLAVTVEFVFTSFQKDPERGHLLRSSLHPDFVNSEVKLKEQKGPSWALSLQQLPGIFP